MGHGAAPRVFFSVAPLWMESMWMSNATRTAAANTHLADQVGGAVTTERAMPRPRRGIRTLIAALWTRRPAAACARNSAADWLPPVLGPSDWPVGFMTDCSGSWYIDRR